MSGEHKTTNVCTEIKYYAAGEAVPSAVLGGYSRKVYDEDMVELSSGEENTVLVSLKTLRALLKERDQRKHSDGYEHSAHL